MTIRDVGAHLQKTFYVDRDDIRHHSRSAGSSNAVHISWKAATDAGYDKLVAPNSLLTSYAETAVSLLIGLPLPGRVTEQTMRFSVPVCACDIVIVCASVVSSWNADTGLMCVGVEGRTEDGDHAVFSGTFSLYLQN